MFALPFLMAFFSADPFDRSTIAIEALPTDSKLDKIVLIAGLPSPKMKTGEHEYFAGCAALMKLLQQTPGVFPVLVKDGLPRNPETLKGAKAVVLFVEGADANVVVKNKLTGQLDELAKAGAGIVHLHSAIDYNKDFHERAKSWAGAVWEKGYSLRAHWVVTLKPEAEHPILYGVQPFAIDDGWLWKLRFVEGMKGITPLMRSVNPKEPPGKTSASEAIIAWAYDRPNGGKSFSFTGGHLHHSLKDENYRRFLVNGILWSAGREIPKAGSSVKIDEVELMRHFDPKPKK